MKVLRSKPVSTRKMIAVLGVLGALGAGSAMAGSAAAATSSPAWSLSTVAVPTVLPRTGEPSSVEGHQKLVITATNSGDITSGAPTLTDTLPAGLIPTFAEGRNRVGVVDGFGEPLQCQIAGQVVSCEGPEGIPPGEPARLEITVEVETGAPAEVYNRIEISGGGEPATSRSFPIAIGTRNVPFGFLEGEPGLATELSEGGQPIDQAAGHPYQANFSVRFPTVGLGESVYVSEEPKAIDVTLPRGMYADPTVTPALCTEAQLESDNNVTEPNGCPTASQVGVASVAVRTFGFVTNTLVKPVFNMVPPPGSPAEFAFDAEQSVYVHLLAHVKSSGEYELAAGISDAPAKLQVLGSSISLWGDPSAESHDLLRRGCLGNSEITILARGLDCSTPRLGRAFVTLPSDCGAQPLQVAGETASWGRPDVFDKRSAPVTDASVAPVALKGCGALPFEPSVTARSDTDRADSPAGLDVDLHQPQHRGYGEPASANLKDAEVTLPEGVTVNPSGANGLGACTEGQIGYQPSDEKIRFSEGAQTCPDSAKIGTVEVSTPLLSHTLPGAVYVAKPFDNPFGSLLAIYLAVEDEQSGIVAKLAGKVTPDPQTGRLTAAFTENPELPIEDVSLHFFGGPKASLKTPLVCGTGTTSSSLVPWSAPEGATAHPTDSFSTSFPVSGSGPCAAAESAAPFGPTLNAGTVTPQAGAYSTFLLRINRNDGERHITSVDTTLPKGLLGKLAGIPYCSEAQISAARGSEAPQKGSLEQANPSCPKASEVGTVTVGAGAGSLPYYVTGHAYLAGPFKGAPLSLVTIVPAIAGPFDLGSVVTRIALNVDPYSAQIDAISDPLPTILDGIPLDVRSIGLKVDRPGFILNPTSCQEKRITGSASSQGGGPATLLNRFQTNECGRLKFKPKLKISLSGSTKRTGLPALKAVVTYPNQGAYANIARAQVNLPHSEFLEQNNLNKTCTKPVLQEGKCPSSTIYGKAKAWSPLLEKPLEGPVYLVGGFGYKLPALVADLNGQIRVLLKGKVDSGPNRGIRATFEAVPDAPVSRFVLEMKGGKKYGLLINSENLCRKPQRAISRFTAQNGRVDNTKPLVANRCGKKGKTKGPGRS